MAKDRIAARNAIQPQLFMLLAAAFLFGGGGVGAGLANLAVQLVALVLLAINLPAVIKFIRGAPRALTVLTLTSMAVPLLQLIPLPPAIWTALPGREMAVEARSLVGASEAWFPLSLDASRTFVGFLGVLPMFATLVLAWNVCRNTPEPVWRAIVLMGLATLALAAVQLASGNRAAIFYTESLRDIGMFGTFANKNSCGLLLVIAFVALTRVRHEVFAGAKGHLIRIAASVLLCVGVILTQSRSSIAILILVGVVVGLRGVLAGRADMTKFRPVLLAGAVILACGIGAGAYLFAENARMRTSIERFGIIDEQRPHIWQDTLAATERYWPAGSGVGTFDEVFQVEESLEYLTTLRAGRAHNDYLEVALEAGIVGVVLLGAWLVWYAVAGADALRRQGDTQRVAAAIGILCFVLQSVLDYPLRSQTLMCVAALLVAILARSGETRSIKSRAARAGSEAAGKESA